VSDDLIELARREARVGRHRPSVELAAGEDESGKRCGILAREHNPISGPDRQASEVVGDNVDRIGEGAIAPGGGGLDQGGMIRSFRHMRCNHLVDPLR
jgi:predicted dinucleotide-binding enzyme